MVSDGCGDCAKRLPQKAKIQTKRAIIKLNLGGTADYGLVALEAARRGFGWPGPRSRLPAVERRRLLFLREAYGAVGWALRSASSSVWLLGVFWSTTRHPSS